MEVWTNDDCTRSEDIALPGPFASISQMAERNERAGMCYFSAETRRWWKSRLCGGVIAGRFHVESARPFGDERRYHVFMVDDDGHTGTVHFPGEHPGQVDGLPAWFRSARQARAALNRCYLTPVTP